MATNFPTSLDTLTNPTSSDSLSSPSHSAQHANANDAIEALQAKVGVDGSAVTSSHDYKISDHASRITTLEGRDTAGLVHISRTTIGSAVSSVTVSGAFSSTYDHYRILVNGGSASTNTFIGLSLPGAATADYSAQLIYSSWTSGAAGAGYSGTQALFHYMGAADTTSLHACIDIQNPYLTEHTYAHAYYARAGHLGGVNIALLNDSASYTDFTIFPSGATFSGGNIDVYGYAKA